jgi:hypothetical protein
VAILRERAVACGATPGGAASDPDERLATGAAGERDLVLDRRPSRMQPGATLDQPVKDQGPKRPHATRTARASRAMGDAITWDS